MACRGIHNREEYLDARKTLKCLVREIREYRRRRHRIRHVFDTISIATVPFYDLVNGNLDECFYDDDTAYMLPWTCGFMRFRFFLENIAGDGGGSGNDDGGPA